MKDAEIYSMASRDNQSATNTAGQSNSSNNTNIKISTDRNIAEAARQKSINSNQVLLQNMGDTAANSRQATQMSSTERLAANDITARATNTDKTLASNEGVANRQIEAQTQAATLERENRVYIANMGNEAAAQLEQDKQQYEIRRDTDISYQSSYSDFQAGLGNIDINASAASQLAQFTRLSQAFNSRMAFLEVLYGTSSAEFPVGVNNTPSPDYRGYAPPTAVR
jgi:hypothetical protein